MYLFKNAKSPFWQARIVIDGRRRYVSTGEAGKRAAESRARELERELRRTAELAKTRADTLDAVFLWFWQAIGRHDRAAKTTFNRMHQLLELLGRDTRIAELSDGFLQAQFLRRRQMPKQRQRRDAGRPVLVAPATVNREIELLRRILNRAEAPLALEIPRIAWAQLRAREPRARVAELRRAEEAALFAALPPAARPLFAFYLASGVRLNMALRLRRADVDFAGGRVSFIQKGGEPFTLPISSAMRAALTAALAPHERPEVFCYPAARARPDQGIARGAWRPFTGSYVDSIWDRAKARAVAAAPGLAGLRIHDLRHTAGTRFLRATGNLAAVQRLLGHSDIRTTLKYTHVDDADLLAQLEGAELGAGALIRLARS